jgi:phage FluMu protein Com
MERVNHAPIRDVEFEASVENIIAKIKNLKELDSVEKHTTITSLEKQIRKRLIKIEEDNLIRYQCPTCGHMYWMKSMLSCEHCGQLLIYGNGEDK